MAKASEWQPPGLAQSKTRGALQREALPRARLAVLAERPGDLDPVEVLQAQDAPRDPSLLGIRYERMVADEFGFLRGAAALMAADLARGPSTELWVQLGGDAHLGNFGAFLTPEGRSVFDVNDFDETCPGPFEWDVKRLAASVAVAGEGLGCTAAQRHRAVLEAVRSYRTAMRRFASMPTLDVWNARLEVSPMLERLGGAMTDEYERRAEGALASAPRRSANASEHRLIRRTSAGPRVVAAPPLVVPLKELPEPEGGSDALRFLLDVVHAYESSLSPARRHLLRQFSPVDAARKVVGVGSVGLRCYVVVLCGRDRDDVFALQVKQAVSSVLEPHLGASGAASHGQRVVDGQALVQATPDPFLGWLDVPDPQGEVRSYYVRQLYDGQARPDLDRFDAGLLRGYGALCGWTLAHGHARSGDRLAIASYLGKSDEFDEAVGSFASHYVARNREDHAALRRAAKDGRVPVEAP